jgi:hypothetical protein
MTTYTMVVRAADGETHEMVFTRDELHTVINALEIADFKEYELDPADELLTEKFVTIVYDWTDWEDIEPDQEYREILQGSRE